MQKFYAILWWSGMIFACLVPFAEQGLRSKKAQRKAQASELEMRSGPFGVKVPHMK